MEKDPSQNYKYFRIAIISLIILFNVAIITAAILNALLAPSGIIEPIDNSDSPYFSEIDFSKIEKYLTTVLKANYDLPTETISNLKAIARKDTISPQFNDENQFIGASFLIDLNEPQLTYLVSYQKNLPDVFFTCPSIELYPNQNVFCIGTDSQSTIDANLDKYLPYLGKTTNGVSFSLKHDYDTNNKPRLDAYADICDDEKRGQEVEESIQKWLKSKGIPNPDIIPVNINYSDCYYPQGEY